jgi:hypothetical protein
MRSLQLQAALSQFVEDAAAFLHAEVAAGAEVGFELAQQSGRRRSGTPTLYCYRPLTEEFIAARAVALERLPSYAEAATLLANFDGLDRYLTSIGVDIGRTGGIAGVRAAIGSLLREVFAEQTDFDLSKIGQHPERLHAALERLEQSTLGSSSEVTLVATLHGLTVSSAEIPLTKGLTIAQPHALEGLPPDALATGEEDAGGHLVVVLALDEDDAREALARGREVLKDLLRALRLFGDGRVTLGALAWARVGAGAWNPIVLGAGGRPRGMLVVGVEQEDELRGFCNLVSRRAPHGNELAWALQRFELGCERSSPYEALTDHLLALRALLTRPHEVEPEGSGNALLATRIAALCATAEERAQLAERTFQALALERAAIDGSAVEHAGGETLAKEVADHLRALLRDVICGHLTADLVALADRILIESERQREPEPQPDELSVRAMPVAAASGEEVFGDLVQNEEILDIFI